MCYLRKYDGRLDFVIIRADILVIVERIKTRKDWEWIRNKSTREYSEKMTFFRIQKIRKGSSGPDFPDY